MASNLQIGSYKYFRITRTVGHKPNGSPVKKQFLGKTKAEAEAKYRAYIRGRDSEEPVTRLTMHYCCLEYNENILNTSEKFSAGTKKKYKACYKNHIEGSWLDRKIISDITAADIQEYYNAAPVSKAVMRTMHNYMLGFWRWCVRSGYCQDVISAVELPKKEERKRKEEIVVWTDAELDTIRSHLSGRRDSFLFLLMIYSGMRISETLGLKYEDVYDDVIHVRRQYYEGDLVPPKWYSKRDIPLHPVLEEALREHEQQYRNSDFIFTTKSGCLYNDANLRREASRFYKKIGVPDKAFHSFRATFATNLCKAGVPLEVASKLLGHSSVSVTARYYTFITDQTKKEAISLLK